MDRRTFMGATAANLVAVSLAAIAQQTAKIPHIGYMSTGSLKINEAFLEAFQDGLRELGYVDGKNIAIDVRWAGDMVSAFPQLAASLVQDNPSAIITTCIPSTRAAKEATRTIPVVMSVDGDPVRAGLIASYARPGGNVTGTATLFEELIPKWLEFLTVALPKARSIAMLTNPDDLIDPFYWGQSEDAAKRLGVKVLRFEASSPADIDRAFTEMKRQDAEGLVVMIEAFLVGQMRRIVQLADRDKLPAIYGFREFTDAGGLMSYGLSYREYYRRMAHYVDAVLKGTKPADLPVEQPTKIELVINLKTAKALGLTIPQPLLVRADEVIE
jgi:putative ABC transport system substrate-binding protein